MRRAIKFLAVSAVAALWQFDVSALTIGDKAKEITGRWQGTDHFQVCYNTIDKRNEKLLKVLVFCDLNDESFSALLPIVRDLNNKSNVRVALIADNEKDIADFYKKYPDLKLPITNDRRSMALYMAGAILFPKAFIVNYENKIIWAGELIDIADVVNKIENGQFKISDEIKISKLLDELQNALRTGDEFKAAKTVDEILKIDPVNRTALRMRLFMLEEQGRYREAYDLLVRQKSKAENSGQIYLLMLDLMTRYGDLRINLLSIVAELIQNQKVDLYDKLTFAWVLMNNFNYNSEALLGAADILENAQTLLPTMAKSNQAFYYSVKACCAYRFGNLPKAIEYQQKSLEIEKNITAERLLNYYLEINEKNK